jgi:hypothetical protein
VRRALVLAAAASALALGPAAWAATDASSTPHGVAPCGTAPLPGLPPLPFDLPCPAPIPATPLPAPAPAPAPGPGGAYALCAGTPADVVCKPGNGMRTPGGGEKVSHKGWPAITGVFWKVNSSQGYAKTGGPDNDELLGHHGSDQLDGAAGKDVLWGDWDPKNNNTSQRDTLNGGPGNDYIYPSHGTTTVDAGPGNDHVWAFYGGGTIDCGPGHDIARVRTNGAFKLRNCEVIGHFCGHGSNGHGGCLKPGQSRKARRTR